MHGSSHQVNRLSLLSTASRAKSTALLHDDELPVDELLALTNAVPMDEEKQQRFAVSFGGKDTEVQYHVWREQTDWVHVYASSTSKEFVDAVEASIKTFERSLDE